MNAAEGMLALLKAEPTLLPIAPVGAGSPEIEHRRLNEQHPCLRCGQAARVALIAAMQDGNRWLDLCPACGHWLRTALDEAVRRDLGGEWRP